MSNDDLTEDEKREQEQRKAEEDAHEQTVRGAQRVLGEDTPLVSEAVAADPVAAQSEPYKSLIAAQGEPIPDDLKDDDDEIETNDPDTDEGSG